MSFNDRRGSDRGRGRGGFDRGPRRDFGGRGGGFRRFPREMHKTTCSGCGKECEVPFKPTEGRPVYCRECFIKSKEGGLPEKKAEPQETKKKEETQEAEQEETPAEETEEPSEDKEEEQ